MGVQVVHLMDNKGTVCIYLHVGKASEPRIGLNKMYGERVDVRPVRVPADAKSYIPILADLTESDDDFNILVGRLLQQAFNMGKDNAAQRVAATERSRRPRR